MKTSNLRYGLIALFILIFSAAVLGMTKPGGSDVEKYVDKLSVLTTQPSANIAGQSCSNMYATTGEYCSGHIRQYYQCLPSTTGGQWERRSENCMDYLTGGICMEDSGKATCEVGVTEHVRNTSIWLSVAIIVGIGLLIGGFFLPTIYLKIAAMFVGGLLLLYGINLAQKLILGGV
jgi:hypothetical protein